MLSSPPQTVHRSSYDYVRQALKHTCYGRRLGCDHCKSLKRLVDEAGLEPVPPAWLVWRIVRKPLIPLAAALFAYAAISAASNKSPVIALLLAAEKGLDLGIVVIIVVLVGLGVRYHVWLGEIERKVVIGFAVYSSFQVVNDTFMQKWMMRYFAWWVSASVISFEAAMLIWIVPLLRPLPPPEPSPTLFAEEESVAILTPILEQLRKILEEMKRITRSKWK